MRVTDPGKMSKIIKKVAKFFGADLVGICKVNPLWIYSHRVNMTQKFLEENLNLVNQ